MEKGKKNITPNAEHMDGGGIKIVTGNWVHKRNRSTAVMTNVPNCHSWP